MTARILSIDTTGEFGSVALLEGERVVEEVLLHAPEGFGHILFEQIKRLLARHGWEVGGIDCFAGAAGPGSFTGIRVGLAAVKGLAEATGRQAVAVSNLQALALFGTAPLRATVLDARRGEVYGAVYDAALEIVRPESVGKFAAWLETLPREGIEFVATDFGPFRVAVKGTAFEGTPEMEAPRAIAGAVGVIAARRLAAGRAGDPAGIDANYVRRSDAELLWKDR